MSATEGKIDEYLNNLGFGFIDDAYHSYFDSEKQAFERKIYKIITSIKTNPDWLASVKKQAAELHITLDKAIRNNAEYVLNEENKKIGV